MKIINLGRTIPEGAIRTPLDRDLVLYVRQEGDDAHDGLTEATAKATLERRAACR